MKSISENVYARGKHGNLYVRRRIPAALRAAYPPHQEHIVRSLGTADRRFAKELARAENTRIDAEFRQKRQELNLSQASLTPKSIAKLDDEQLQAVAKFWLRQVLMTDEQRRQAGLDDDEFDELGEKLTEQRAELGRMLAQGKSLNIFPALHGFLYLCGLDFNPDLDEAKRASYAFLRTVIETLEHQLKRQRGDIVDTDKVAPAVQHPLTIIAPERAPVNPKLPTWDMAFETWRVYVDNRPKPTTIASQTPWRDLQKFAKARGVQMPGEVTPELMTAFVEDMRPRLEVSTLNERLTKIRGIYRVAVGKHVLKSNPAAGTLGVKESSAKKRKKRRLPFDVTDLQTIFGSEVFTQHKRSRGQSGEASYWIPLLMFYTGARPEELAGLALSDLVHDPKLGWSLSIVDRLSDDDVDLFDNEVPESHRRTLKNAVSVRRVPVAPRLIELGLLRYVEWLRERKATVFFPALKKDFHGKLSGSFSKFFGRYKRALGITDKRKVLYSFRHCMKDTLEAAGVPSKYLQRLLGHTTGDGHVTDGYGSDLPFNRLAMYFSRIQFAAIPARPWEPGRGSVSLKGED
ncbi:site-specific integrase [Thiomonas sp. FB-Cd]|uniref:site-specific integrase n=1 Tax=Thiomonas sp. FB-Cd TaxID=1158292 RepID=UPI0004DF0FA2|nr:site-specific integrase [Thiomonas sp. FB-Cd]